MLKHPRKHQHLCGTSSLFLIKVFGFLLFISYYRYVVIYSNHISCSKSVLNNFESASKCSIIFAKKHALDNDRQIS